MELNPSSATVESIQPRNQIGNSIIYTQNDFNKLVNYNNSESEQLENLKSNQEITIKQTQEIDRLRQQLMSVTDEIEQLNNQQDTETELVQQATLEGAKAIAPERIKQAIWQDAGGQIKLAVYETTDYLITL